MSPFPPGSPGNILDRLFRRRIVGGNRRGSDSYHSVSDGLPGWTEGIPNSGNILGVYENVIGSSSNALVFYGDKMVSLDIEGAVVLELSYADMWFPKPFSKNPIAREITVVTRDGREITFNLHGKPGEVSTFARFVYNIRA